MKNCVLIYNPNSGHTMNEDNLKSAKKVLPEYGYNVRIIPTKYAGHAKEIVSHLESCDLVISVGGDGTFNEVVTGNMQRKNKLLLANIPIGTTNDIGTMFGYGKNFESNLKMLMEGNEKGIDICMVNDRPFVYVAGLGKFINIAYDTPRYMKKKYGYFAYLFQGVKDFFKPIKSYRVDYEVNGLKKTGYFSFILISNANRIGGINMFYKDVKLDDNQFEVLLCNFTTRRSIIRALRLLIDNDPNKISGLEFYKTSRIKFDFELYPKNAWCIDGEKLDRRTKTFEFTTLNNFRILMPNKNVKKLFIKKDNLIND
ncbi:MAG: YegS/Rv2252/BmrU family lipid kinase [Bacilli bacterium]|nr:YegS/Rv2252/BmrU family lipid kinase [Bacilli bacterium]